MEKHGLVLLPFMDRSQLSGFHSQECKEISFPELLQVWEKQKSKIASTPVSLSSPLWEEMQPDEQRSFSQHPLFLSNYQHQPVQLGWLSHMDGIIPLKPFIAVEDCEDLGKQIRGTDDPLSIFWDQPAKKRAAKVNMNQEGKLFNLSIVSEDRNIMIKGIEFKQDEEGQELLFTVHVGRKRPFVEVIMSEGRMFLVNGLQRLYSMIKAGLSDTKIPCVLLQEQHYPDILKAHPYACDILTAERPPILADFFNSDIVFEVPLQTGFKQLQIFTQDNYITID